MTYIYNMKEVLMPKKSNLQVIFYTHYSDSHTSYVKDCGSMRNIHKVTIKKYFSA